jgi:recyclin-1
VIADLNAYHAFIVSLKVSYITSLFQVYEHHITATIQVPTIVSEFAYLKMLGHVYVVEDAKDLAQIVRDVTRYGGAYRPEVCTPHIWLC